MAYDYSLPTEDYHQIYRFLEISQNDFNQKEISKLKKRFGKLFGAPTLFDCLSESKCHVHSTIVTDGLLNVLCQLTHYLRWLGQGVANQRAVHITKICEIELLYRRIAWQRQMANIY